MGCAIITNWKENPDGSPTRIEGQAMKRNEFPPGWDEERVQKVIDYYENQTEDEAVAEAEAGLQDESIILMEVPTE